MSLNRKAASAEDVLPSVRLKKSFLRLHLNTPLKQFFSENRGASSGENVTCSTQLYTKTQFFTIPLHQQDRTAFFPLDNRE